MTSHLRSGAGRVLAGALILLAATACSSTPEATPDATTPDPAAAATSTEAPSTQASSSDSTPNAAVTPVSELAGSLSIEVIAVHPHDPDAFTQGLELTDDGRFAESTGLYGESDRRIVDVDTGEVQTILPLDPTLFGEGMTIVGDELVQITWKAGIYIRSDLATLAETSRGTYDGEGWGLCHDGNQFVMSNGTAALTFRNTTTFEAERSVDVTLDGEPIGNLNELECVGDRVVANVWLLDMIIVIDPATGVVVATADGSALRPDDAPFGDSSFALNGIAHDQSTGHWYLTGKRWPVLYEVMLS